MPMPKPLTIPFARDALSQFINEIPDTPQSGADPQLASWSEGFGPITMQPLHSGGKPPEGPDFNGILSALSEHIVYQNGGGIYTFSQEYVDKTGGYDKDSVLISDDGSALWVSLSDDNAENFNTATPPTEWIKISAAGVEQQLEDILNSLDLKADKTIQVIAGTGLSGGGNLQASRTLSVNYGTTAGTAAQGNDERIVNSVRTTGNQTISGLKTFSQFPVTPSAAPTADYQVANKKYVDDASNPWISRAIGEPFPIFDHLTGIEVPPTNNPNFRFIKLSAGENGVGGYNEGALTNETISGSAPLVFATAEISFPDSPLAGQRINLLNTEGRYIKPGTSPGGTQFDRFQGHAHSISYTGTAQTSGVSPTIRRPGLGGSVGEGWAHDIVSDGVNGTPRIGNSTDVKHQQATYYMRIA